MITINEAESRRKSVRVRSIFDTAWPVDSSLLTEPFSRLK